MSGRDEWRVCGVVWREEEKRQSGAWKVVNRWSMEMMELVVVVVNCMVACELRGPGGPGGVGETGTKGRSGDTGGEVPKRKWDGGSTGSASATHAHARACRTTTTTTHESSGRTLWTLV